MNPLCETHGEKISYSFSTNPGSPNYRVDLKFSEETLLKEIHGVVQTLTEIRKNSPIKIEINPPRKGSKDYYISISYIPGDDQETHQEGIAVEFESLYKFLMDLAKEGESLPVLGGISQFLERLHSLDSMISPISYEAVTRGDGRQEFKEYLDNLLAYCCHISDSWDMSERLKSRKAEILEDMAEEFKAEYLLIERAWRDRKQEQIKHVD